MNKFEFKDSIKVNIAGEVVQLKIGGTVLDDSIKFGKYIQKKANGLDKLEYKEAIKIVCDECDKYIDSITEPGAAKRIFKNRGNDPYDRMQVVNFLIEEIKENKIGSFSEEKYTPNRAQRRHSKKNK